MKKIKLAWVLLPVRRDCCLRVNPASTVCKTLRSTLWRICPINAGKSLPGYFLKGGATTMPNVAMTFWGMYLTIWFSVMSTFLF